MYNLSASLSYSVFSFSLAVRWRTGYGRFTQEKDPGTAGRARDIGGWCIEMSQVQGDGLPRPWVPVGVWWLLVAWLILAVTTVVWAIPHEEQDLQTRAERALAEAGLPVMVDFAGRDATLSGTVDSLDGPERAVEVVEAVTGVRRAVGDVEVAAEPEPLRDPTVTVTIADGQITLSGLVPSQTTSTAIVAAAVGQFGADAVTNEVTVAEDVATADWLDLVGEAIADLGPLGNGSATFDVTGVTLTGVVGSADAVDSLQMSMELLFGDEVVVRNRLSVAARSSPTLQASAAEDRVELSGTMPDQASVDALVTGAIGVHGSDGVTSSLVVGDVGSPEWLPRLPDLFGAVGGLDSWTAAVEGGHLTVTGFGADQAAVNAASAALDALVLPGLDLAASVEIDPSALAATLTDLAAGTVTFEPGTGTMSPSSSDVLDEIAAILLANPSTSLTVEGHTEDLGNAASAVDVSRREANAVADYLVAAGVDPARLSTIGYGSNRPVADNATAAGRDRNRRVEFSVREGDG